MPVPEHCSSQQKMHIVAYVSRIAERHCCGVAEEAGACLAPSPLLPNKLSGQEINENGLNGVHKSAFEPVTSSQNKRRKLNPHLSSESDNHSQPTSGDPVVEQQGDQRQ